MAGEDMRTGSAAVGRGLVPVRGKGGPPLLFDEERRGVFLEALRESCHLGRSAAAAGVSSGTVYAHRMRDAAFGAALEEALADGAGRLRQDILDRAIDAAAGPDMLDGSEWHDETERNDGTVAGAGAERPKRWLAARLGAVPDGRATASRKARRAIPRGEVDRQLLDAVERIARGIRP